VGLVKQRNQAAHRQQLAGLLLSRGAEFDLLAALLAPFLHPAVQPALRAVLHRFQPQAVPFLSHLKVLEQLAGRVHGHPAETQHQHSQQVVAGRISQAVQTRVAAAEQRGHHLMESAAPALMFLVVLDQHPPGVMVLAVPQPLSRFSETCFQETLLALAVAAHKAPIPT
jgi:hypothetical protein